ncbi:MAG: hypothetical protein HC829_02495 [Bacteroidales bacterium]|nr:hypothetical protein [Bacteroidales bacterium]
MKIDLAAPIFTQADVLEILPGLKAKTLQNWNERRLLDTGDQTAGRGGKRMYSGINIIKLSFMNLITEFGIGPKFASETASFIVGRANDVHSNHKIIVEDDGVHWAIDAGNIDSYKVGFITKKTDSRYDFELEDQHHSRMRRFGEPHIYLSIEVDFHILSTLNSIYRHLKSKEKDVRADVRPVA